MKYGDDLIFESTTLDITVTPGSAIVTIENPSVTGPTGPQGDIGPTGPAGADGATGSQGPTGAVATNQNAFIANFTPITTFIPQHTPVPLDTNLILSSDITHTPNTPDIVLAEGIYSVEYTAVTGTDDAVNASAEFTLDGVAIPGSATIVKGLTVAIAVTISGGFIVSVGPGSGTLRMVADSNGGNTYDSGFSEIPNITIRIIKLS
ncbi:hypothetical protein [Oscillibacter sp.]|uniref:hypothetical protein n=1 Tax=Oscillibacter sp. TaxID=1945593 RepID=UPI00289B137C|nr:hypothetical protein [Oscillibacter sp.]